MTTITTDWNMADLLRPWFQLAPSNLTQPILSGWTLNVNSNNSSAPQTEVDVVAKHSYGRQIGRMADALKALIHDTHKDVPEDSPLHDFLEMWDEINEIKLKSAESQISQIASDLDLLKKEKPQEYERLRHALNLALQQTA